MTLHVLIARATGEEEFALPLSTSHRIAQLKLVMWASRQES